MTLSKQYNAIAEDFSKLHDIGENSNRFNRKIFYEHIDFIKPGMKVLDLGCGDGIDLIYYQKLGADIYGVDASEGLITIAKEKLPNANIQVGFFENISFPKEYFDVVFSKYAIQTSEHIEPIFDEVKRVLKPNGIFMYLVTHPFRQYLEKKEKQADYFEQKIVYSSFFDNTITVQEPSHTLNEYLNERFLKDFDLQLYQECWDAGAEQIEGKKYPGFFIVIAKKRK